MLRGFQRLRRCSSCCWTEGIDLGCVHSVDAVLSCWRHRVTCAILAERVARWGFLDKDFPYTARILHEIGKVALTATMPGSLRACRCHHDRKSLPSGTARLITLSCELSEVLALAISSGPRRSNQEILADFPEVARGRFPGDMAELASGIASEIQAIESA
jgi:hypothetical protein